MPLSVLERLFPPRLRGAGLSCDCEKSLSPPSILMRGLGVEAREVEDIMDPAVPLSTDEQRRRGQLGDSRHVMVVSLLAAICGALRLTDNHSAETMMVVTLTQALDRSHHAN